MAITPILEMVSRPIQAACKGQGIHIDSSTRLVQRTSTEGSASQVSVEA